MTTLARAPIETVRIISADIKIAHSVFALPFAIFAACMAAPWNVQDAVSVLALSSGARVIFIQQIALVIAAMVLARTVAMLANRLLDRSIDARNPRTAGRAIPSGRLSATTALAVLLGCTAGFMLVCAAFGWLFGNWWPLILAVPVLAWISAYALFKRFTALCHIYLGTSLAISPLAAAIAIDPAAVTSQPALWLLALMVMCWVAGFDIIYALQDVSIDRRQHLYSMPARLGERTAMFISRALHVVAVLCLIGVVAIDPRLNILSGTAIAIIAGLLIYEHATVARWGTTRIALAFFTLNGIISCLLGALGVADLLIS